MVRTIQTALPRRELKEFVRCYAQREIACTEAGFAQPNITTVDPAIAFNLSGQTFLDYSDGQSKLSPKTTVYGPITGLGGGAHFSGHILAFAIFLKPLALWQLFRIPIGVLTDRDCDGEDLLGKGIQDLWLMVAESKTFQERVHLAEQYLLPFAVNAADRTSTMKTAQYMIHQKGAIRIDELAYQTSLSVRHYERRFAEQMGVSPKLFARITRFGMALDTKRVSPSNSWASVAHELGYFDQMHMVRDFRNLGGDAPGEVLQLSGDIQPWSIASPMTLHHLTEPSELARLRKLSS